MLLHGLFGWLRPHWSAVVFWAIDPSQIPAPPAGRVVTNLGRDVDPEAVLTLASAATVTATEAALRLARGSHCLSLLVDGEVATTCWVSERPEWLGELAGWFVPGTQEAYVWDCATRPVYRGRHLYPDLLCAALRQLADQGFRRAWIATEWQNWRSARGVTRAGFRPVGVVVCGRVAGLRWQHVIPDPDASLDLVDALRRGLSGLVAR